MNGIYCLGYLTPYCFMDSIIQTLKCLLNVLLNKVCSTSAGQRSYHFTLAQQGEHNIAMYSKGVGFYRDRAGDCHSQYLGVVRYKIDTSHSPPTFSILYGSLRVSLPVVNP